MLSEREREIRERHKDAYCMKDDQCSMCFLMKRLDAERERVKALVAGVRQTHEHLETADAIYDSDGPPDEVTRARRLLASLLSEEGGHGNNDA
jgi:hypothetical protein